MGPWRRAAACCALTLAAVTAVTACQEESGDGLGATGTTASTAGTAGTAGSTPGQPASPTPTPAPTVPVGERVVAAGYELVVHEVTAPAPHDAVTPAPGRMLMTVDVELVNRTASARDATYLRVEVVDAAGTRYAPSPEGDNLPTGWLPAGVPQRGVQLYEVPLDATGLVLTLQPDLVSGVAAAVPLR